MLKTLLKKQMMEIFRTYFYDPKKNKRRSVGATVAYMLLFVLLMVGLVGGMFAYLAYSVCGAFVAGGADWMYISMFSLLAIFLGAFGSVFNTFSQLYLAKDNDLLLSMPIPSATIITSRLLGVYLLGLMYSAVVIVPAVIIYWVNVRLTAAVIVSGILLTALISVIVLLLSCLLGWVVAKISLKLKNKSFVTVIVSLAFFGLYYFFYFKASAVIQDLVANAAEYGEKLKSSAYALYVLGQGGCGSWRAMLIVTAVVAAAAVLTWCMLSKSFLKIATASGAVSKTARPQRAEKCRTADDALLTKEFRRFTSSPLYMLNCGLGVLFLLAAAVMIIIKGDVLRATLGAVFGTRPGALAVLSTVVICLIAMMNDMAAPSVSLEGKSIWIPQSLPIAPWQALRAKLRMHLLLTGIPAGLCAVCAGAVLTQSAAETVLLLIAVLSVVTLSAVFSLTLGVKMPNLTWTNEAVPVKQSGSVLIAIFGGWIYAAALGVLYLVVGTHIGGLAYLALFSAVSLALAFALYRWLKTRGAVIFASL